MPLRTAVLLILLAFGALPAFAQPAAVTGLAARVGDRSVILRWDRLAAGGVVQYRVFRAEGAGPFERIATATRDAPVVLDFAVENDRTYRYTVQAVSSGGQVGPNAEPLAANPRVLTDAEFRDLVAHTAFDYFWYEANPANGLIRDRSTNPGLSSVAAVGFGLTAYGVGVERGYITRAQATTRTLTTLRTFANGPQGPERTGRIGYKGFFYHFLEMDTAVRAGQSELSTIDTALLLGGVLYARGFFDGASADEAEIRRLATLIYERVDWTWAMANPPLVALGWRPEAATGSERDGFRICNGGFCDWRGYNEAMILYLLGLGSPTHPLPAESWTRWTDSYVFQFSQGFEFVRFPPLFGHQYSHVWFDFRGTRDAYMRARGLDYFENSRRATLAQIAYTTRNPGGFEGYGPDGWGITPSDGPDGYRARGATPPENDDGTLAPTGPGGSFAFTPERSLSALRSMYTLYRTRLWGPYGFRDAYNVTVEPDYFAPATLGIDQGPIVLMIDNAEREGVWNVFMRDEAARRGLERAGFVTVVSAEEAPGVPALALAVAPNPAGASAEATVTLADAGPATLDAYDVLGRRVRTFDAGRLGPGTYRVPLDLAALAPGTYALVLRAGGRSATTPFVRLP